MADDLAENSGGNPEGPLPSLPPTPTYGLPITQTQLIPPNVFPSTFTGLSSNPANSLPSDRSTDVLTPEQMNKAILDRDAFGDMPHAIKAGLLATARGFSLGLSDPALAWAGITNKEEIDKLSEANPFINVTGNVGGLFGGLLLGGLPAGVAKLGAMVEGGVAARLGAMGLEKGLAKTIVQRALPAAAGLGVEGAAYGGGQAVSEALLGDPNMNAEKIMSTVGLSSVLGAAIGGPLGVLKPVAKDFLGSIIPTLKEKFAHFANMSPHAFDTIAARPEEVAAIEDLADNPVNARQAHANNIAEQLTKANDAFEDGRYGSINTRTNASDQFGATYSAEPIFKAIDDHLTSSVEKGVQPADYPSLLNKAAGLKDRIRTTALTNIEPAEKEALGQLETISGETTLPDADLQLTAGQMNIFRRQLNQESKAVFDAVKRGTLPDTPSYAFLAKNTADSFRSELDNILVNPETSDQSIREINKELGDVINARKALNRYGLMGNEMDGSKLVNLFSTGDAQIAKVQPHLDTINKYLGVDLSDNRDLVKAMMESNPANSFMKIKTGASLYPIMTGFMGGTILGGSLTKGAAGGLAGAAMAAPMFARRFLKPLASLENALNNPLNKYRLAVNKLAPLIKDGLIPAGVGGAGITLAGAAHRVNQLHVLSQMENQKLGQDRQIKNHIDDFFSGNVPYAPAPSLNILENTNYGEDDGEDRE